MNMHKSVLSMVPAFILGSFFLTTACNPPDHVGNNGPNDTPVGGGGATVRPEDPAPRSADGRAVSAATDRTGVVMTHGDTIVIMGAAPGTAVYDERYKTSSNMRGYRAQLMSELEAIRLRLNDGTRQAEAIEKDRSRAADLAQGLERMDRLIKAAEVSDDLTWARIRRSQLKEAEEVRNWAQERGFRRS